MLSSRSWCGSLQVTSLSLWWASAALLPWRTVLLSHVNSVGSSWKRRCCSITRWESPRTRALLLSPWSSGVNLRLSEPRRPLWPWNCVHTWSGYWLCPVSWAEVHSTSGLWTFPAFWQWKPLYHELQLKEPGLQVSKCGGLARGFRGVSLRSLTISAFDYVCSSCWGGICVLHFRNLESDSSFVLMVGLWSIPAPHGGCLWIRELDWMIWSPFLAFTVWDSSILVEDMFSALSCLCYARCLNPQAEREKAFKTMQLAKKGKFITDSSQGFCRNQRSGAGSEKAPSPSCYINL